jgi:hypothetical protein
MFDAHLGGIAAQCRLSVREVAISGQFARISV